MKKEFFFIYTACDYYFFYITVVLNMSVADLVNKVSFSLTLRLRSEGQLYLVIFILKIVQIILLGLFLYYNN